MLAAKLRTILNIHLTANQAKQTHACIIINGLNSLKPLLVRQILLSTRNSSRRISQYVHNILYHLPHPDSFSWGWAIRYFSQQGQFKEALYLYVQMQRQGLCPSTFAVSSALRAYARTTHKMGGMSIHAESYKYGFSNCVYVQTALVDLYSKLGDMNIAQKVFDELAEKNVVSWNSILSGHLKSGNLMEAQRAYANIQPDQMTLASVVSACSQLGDMRFASWIESYVNDLGTDIDDQLVTALLDLYAKCGSVDKACELFHGLNKKDVVAYSAMISGCGINGKVGDAIKLFVMMVDAQIRPNLATFTGLLTACNHAGLVEEGYQFVSSMKDHGLVPSIDHYAIMVDLLGRAGRLQDAYELIKSMPMQPHSGVWGALLLACSVHNNVELGEIAAEHCFALETNATAYYSLLANIYSSAGRWDDVRRLRKLWKENKLVKLSGCSWTEST
ncbi:hypothetical protein OIU74_014657 [Salix koriyanagi]|uniref:Pentatricopeptide repeat-containing protein n=1 Tax=Salix koriyanagi TaxID=2511006 RepID=A0A9Q0PX32_9ROSI|nr:hypothetical protein OIU74_014657 [Salix koriyanagi]KAJ6695587.1 hypothetical protein OIU74_014657 [Salix koriyanagi]